MMAHISIHTTCGAVFQYPVPNKQTAQRICSLWNHNRQIDRIPADFHFAEVFSGDQLIAETDPKDRNPRQLHYWPA